ncbi:hypothetical protein [Pseudanabaena sp. ABRG5-3]|nr:hypothetical protein [Pseudanabaena sp. ABRG5-3]
MGIRASGREKSHTSIMGKNKTPAMVMGLYHRQISMLELLSLRGFTSLTS